MDAGTAWSTRRWKRLDRYLKLDHDFIGAALETGHSAARSARSSTSRSTPIPTNRPTYSAASRSGMTDVVGWVTSGAFAHYSDVSLAFGYVPAELAAPGGVLASSGGGWRSRSSATAARRVCSRARPRPGREADAGVGRCRRCAECRRSTTSLATHPPRPAAGGSAGRPGCRRWTASSFRVGAGGRGVARPRRRSLSMTRGSRPHGLSDRACPLDGAAHPPRRSRSHFGPAASPSGSATSSSARSASYSTPSPRGSEAELRSQLAGPRRGGRRRQPWHR